MLKKVVRFALATFFLPVVTFAHVKWFAVEEAPVRPYEFTDTPVIIATVLALIITSIGFYLDKKLKIPYWFKNFITRWSPHTLTLASMGFGLAFIIFSYNGFIFAPNLVPQGLIAGPLILLQALAGVMILLGLYERVGGALILLLFALSVSQFGGVEMLDTLEMVGFAIYAIIVGRPKWKIADTNIFQTLTHHIHDYGVPILRVATGLNLIILGFSEKILTPSLTANFLSSHHWNFMQMLGFEQFTNYWFAFSAGATEALFGLLLVLGVVTRLTTITLAVFLVTTLFLLGPVELIGHIPHFSIAIVLLVLGAGSKLRLRKNVD